jgi:hypothetical protein
MLVRLTSAGDCVLNEEHLLEGQLGRTRDVRVDASG